MNISRETRVGFFVVIALIGLFIGFKYLQGLNMFDKNREYKVKFDDVRGLTENGAVMYRGIRVGLVKSIELDKDNDSLDVTIIISNDRLKIMKGAQALLKGDLLGTQSLVISFPDSAAKNLIPQGGYLLGRKETELSEQLNEQIIPIKRKAESLIANLDSVVTSINAFWDTETSGNVSESVDGVRRAILSFERTANRIDTLVKSEKNRISKIFRNVDAITTNLSENNEAITSTINGLDTLANKMARLEFDNIIECAEKSLCKIQLIVDQINSGQGTLGNLVYNDSLHDEIIQTNAYLQLLIKDIKNFPSRYMHFSIFGSRVKGAALTPEEETVIKKMVQSDGQIRRFTEEEYEKIMHEIKEKD